MSRSRGPEYAAIYLLAVGRSDCQPAAFRLKEKMGNDHPRIVVIGGGVSGLAAAHRVLELNPAAEVTLLEAGPRLGGVVHTERRDGFLIEHGAENFLTTLPGAIDLCERIGFSDELVPTNEAHRRAFVLRKGRLKPIPAGFAVMAPSRAWPVLSSSILSPWGKLRLAGEAFVRRRQDPEDESLASFVTRRLGRETYDRLVQPLVAGIYTANPEKLSIDAAMPRFREMERRHGSLIRAMWKQRRESRTDNGNGKASGARYSQFVAPRDGMTALINAVAARLPATGVHLHSPVERLDALPGNRWRIVAGGADRREFTADGVVLALPARRSAVLLRHVDAQLATELEQIEYATCALATFGFRREQIEHPLDGFGVVIPLAERRNILSATFSSIKYPGRAPAGHVLIRTYLGGACQPELMERDDGALLAMAQQEVVSLLGIKGSPVLQHINRQQDAMPQYHVGHLSLARRLDDRASKLGSLVLAGNSLHGVGIPQCIRTAETAVERLLTRAASLRQADSPPADSLPAVGANGRLS
jgi:oxygen-dependent protoporphyrinogen oxidase